MLAVAYRNIVVGRAREGFAKLDRRALRKMQRVATDSLLQDLSKARPLIMRRVGNSLRMRMASPYS